MDDPLQNDTRSLSLLALGRALKAAHYRFVTVTPETHHRVNARAERMGQASARTPRDVFGWNRPFEASVLPSEWLRLLRDADALHHDGERFRCGVRFSTLGGRLFVHSAFPTRASDAVFFGPDSYRFCTLLDRWVTSPHQRAVDLGCGSGVGGIHVSQRVQELVLSDINSHALSLARVNAALASVHADLLQSDLLRDLSGSFDLIIANPPYMRDAEGRTYRDGGGGHGEALSVRIVADALSRLSPGGMLVLYTGAAIVDGVDSFYESVAPLLKSQSLTTHYEELDPDVFGEELELPHYADVERIAAVGLRIIVG